MRNQNRGKRFFTASPIQGVKLEELLELHVAADIQSEIKTGCTPLQLGIKFSFGSFQF